MNKLFEKINKEKLTLEEKRRGISVLQKFMRENKPTKIKSPFYNPWTIFIRQKTFIVPIVLFLIFSLSTGTVLASKNSLPGDVLYPVKLLNEKLESATSLSKISQVEVEVKHTITRLTETEKLASEGRLNNNLGTEIEKQFDTQAKQTIQNITELKDSGALIDAAKISSDFESSLSHHEKAISQLSNSTTTETKGRIKLSDISSNIQNKIEETSKIQTSLENSIASSSDKVSAKSYAENKLKSSQEKINVLQKHIENSGNTNQNTNIEVKTNIDDAKNIINQSQKKIDEGSLNDAFKLLKQADKTTEKAAEEHDVKTNQDVNPTNGTSDTQSSNTQNPLIQNQNSTQTTNTESQINTNTKSEEKDD